MFTNKPLALLILALLNLNFHAHAVQIDPAEQENFSQRIEQLFARTHSYSEERRTKLNSWLGINEAGQSSPETGNWLSFLEANWSNNYFRPFDEAGVAEDYLIQHRSARIIIRLSSSQPGNITLTVRQIDGSIIHTRCTLQGENIIFSRNEYTLDALIKHFKPRNISTYITR